MLCYGCRKAVDTQTCSYFTLESIIYDSTVPLYIEIHGRFMKGSALAVSTFSEMRRWRTYSLKGPEVWC